MDITQELKDTENSLRDFVSAVLRKKFGESWLENCGVSADRREKWNKRKVEEEKRQEAGTVEQRLIYYSDFYDLKTILKHSWKDEISKALGDWKTMEVWLNELGKLRDPDAHRCELLPHQKHLILGISGEIRTRLVRYRSKMETSEDYYPRIESARDSLGSIWTYDSDKFHDQYVVTRLVLRAGDVIDFVITATDPMGEPLQYAIYSQTMPRWQEDNTLVLRLAEEHVEKRMSVMLAIRSKRQYHAHKNLDDFVQFVYEVLPPK